MKTIAALLLLALAPAAHASMSCEEYPFGTYLCTESVQTYYHNYSWSHTAALGTLNVSPNGLGNYYATFICYPLQPTRHGNGYYTQTVRTGTVHVSVTNYYSSPPSTVGTTANVTCKSQTPAEAGLPELMAVYVPPYPPEPEDHGIWWFLRLFGTYGFGWNIGSDVTCYTNSGCDEESPYNDQQ